MIRQFLMSAMLVTLLLVLTASSVSAKGLGSPAQATDRRDISVVGSAVSSVAVPPSLQGELLGAECSAFPPSGFTCVSGGQGSVTTTCTLQTDGTAVLSFNVTNGVASGPYPGTFSESGSYTLGPANSGGGGVGERVISFSSSFNIQAQAGTVVGTKTGTAAQQSTDSHNFCTAFTGQFGTFAGAFAGYEATIQTAQGTFRDTGSTLAQVGASSSAPTGFFEAYTFSNGVASPFKIAFASNRDGNFEIYSMNADGGAQARLTTNPAFDGTPSFSADGTKIAFESSRTGNGDIYVMNADGSGQTRLTTSSAVDLLPTFSPDGTKIAFTSFRTGNGDIYVMNADGSGQTRLTTSAAVDAEPTWSPDGTKIAFTSGRTGNGDVYVMNADGSGQTRLTTSAAIDSSPDWSIDGTKIAFTSNRDGNFEIYSMNPDGSAQTRLTNNPAFDGDPAFLSTGKIAFSSNRDGNFEIYSMNADGSGQTRLTVNPAVDISPDAP
jgi:dipeptidyl aminopeptidase/acylaminoacyl peptidase